MTLGKSGDTSLTMDGDGLEGLKKRLTEVEEDLGWKEKKCVRLERKNVLLIDELGKAKALITSLGENLECLTQELAKKNLKVSGGIGKLKAEYEGRIDELNKECFDLKGFLEEKDRNQK